MNLTKAVLKEKSGLFFNHEWLIALRDDLPSILKAYMLGYSLHCLEQKRFDNAIHMQKNTRPAGRSCPAGKNERNNAERCKAGGSV